MAVDPFGVTLAVVAQQRQVAGALLGHQHVTVGEHEQATWIDEPGGERLCDKPLRDLQCLPVIGHGQRSVGYDRPGFRGRQIGRIDVKAPADLMLGEEVLRERVAGGCPRRGGRGALRRRGRKQKSASYRGDECNGRCAQGLCHGDHPGVATCMQTQLIWPRSAASKRKPHAG
jgi:hypothetical protein